MKKYGKCLAACLLVCMMTVGMLLPVSAEASTVDLFAAGASLEEPTPYSNINANSNEVASMFEVKNGKMVGFVLSSLSNNVAAKGILKIYKWDTNYAKTTSQKAVIQLGFNAPAVSEPTDFRINFDGAYAEGKYLAVIKAESALLIWTHHPLDGVSCFIDGSPYTTGSFKLQYVVDPAKPAKNSDKDFDSGLTVSTVTTVPLFGSGAALDGAVNFQLYTYYCLATKFTNDRGKLVGLVLDDTRIEGDDGELTVWLYKWDTDYETTVKSVPCYYKVYTLPMTDEANPDVDRILEFDRAFAEGEYLALFETEDSMISFWAHAPKEGVELYVDDEPYTDAEDAFMATLKIAYLADPAAELDERPVDYPTPEPSKEPTPTPSVTVTPKPTPTKADPTPTTAPKGGDSNSSWIWIVVIAVVVVAAVAAAVVIVMKKKKKG